MPNIRPVSDLRNRFKDIEKELKSSDEPLFLTVNGRSSMVLMNNDSYDKLTIKNSEQPCAAAKKRFTSVITTLMNTMEVSHTMVAVKAGMSHDEVNQMVQGDYIPNPEQLEKLAQYLKVKPDTLQMFLDSKEDDKIFDAMVTMLEKFRT